MPSSIHRSENPYAAELAGESRPYRSLELVEAALRRLMAADLATLPLPAQGETLARWQALAQIGAVDLSLAKLLESHADAQAILRELGADFDPGALLAVWAAEAPGARVTAECVAGKWQLRGSKAWCSGAAAVDYGLITVWTEAPKPFLALVPMAQAGVRIESGGWQTAAMAAAETAGVHFSQARAEMIGAAGDYLQRPGFWQGGAGIAAVWFGAATALAEGLRSSARVASDPFAAAHLGAVDGALQSARAVLREAASWLDAHPLADAQAIALRARMVVENAALTVLDRVERALGPGPLVTNAEHAQRAADLRLFLRQSHAEADWAQLGKAVSAEPGAWNL